MSYIKHKKSLIAEYSFNGLKIKLYAEDLQHALDNHPGEVSEDVYFVVVDQFGATWNRRNHDGL